MDERLSTEDIADELKAQGDIEMLAEGAEPEESERYDLAGNYETLVAGIVRYVEQQREKE